MILGRTSGGAIKTKSDGGLRAVNCACCGGGGGCQCGLIRSTATPELLAFLQNVTGATNNGIAATQFNLLSNDPEENLDWPVSWEASWCLTGVENCNVVVAVGWYGWETDPTSDYYQCFYMFGFRNDVFPYTAIRWLETGTSACPPTAPNYVNSNDANFTINGENFPCHQSYDPLDPLAVIPIPNLVFT